MRMLYRSLMNRTLFLSFSAIHVFTVLSLRNQCISMIDMPTFPLMQNMRESLVGRSRMRQHLKGIQVSSNSLNSIFHSIFLSFLLRKCIKEWERHVYNPWIPVRFMKGPVNQGMRRYLPAIRKSLSISNVYKIKKIHISKGLVLTVLWLVR